MRKIENAQKELCEFLISIMPVEWKKICFYSKCTSGSRTTWIALVEKETGAICTEESFWDRYNEYPCKETDVVIKLCKLMKNLYNAYLEKFGDEKIWCTYYLTINENYTFNVDFGYEMPTGNLIEQHDAVVEWNCQEMCSQKTPKI